MDVWRFLPSYVHTSIPKSCNRIWYKMGRFSQECACESRRRASKSNVPRHVPSRGFSSETFYCLARLRPGEPGELPKQARRLTDEEANSERESCDG